MEPAAPESAVPPQEPDPLQAPAGTEAARKDASVEIHPAHRPIHSFGDFVLQLITITAGVLIALSLEGLAEWNHYRTLVREARETIDRVADNKRELDGSLASAASRRKSLDTALRLADELLATKRLTFAKSNSGRPLQN